MFLFPDFALLENVHSYFSNKETFADNLWANDNNYHDHSKFSVCVISKHTNFTNDAKNRKQKVLNFHNYIDDVHPNAFVDSKRQLNSNGK